MGRSPAIEVEETPKGHKGVNDLAIVKKAAEEAMR
jgi:hypothetical protein